MNKIIKLSGLVVAGLILSVAIATGVNAINPKTTAIFNAYETVQLHYGVGSEQDFLRLGTRGELGNEIEVCKDGQVVDLWLYVHNSTSEEANYSDFSGPGVATNTKIALDIDESAVGQSHSVVASIDSDQTSPITDGVTITCNQEGKQIKVAYKTVSDFGHKAPALKTLGNFNFDASNILNGALLGYQSDEAEGIVPGCWQYRARINVQLTVSVIEQAEEQEVEMPPELTETGSQSQALTLALLIIGTITVATIAHRQLAMARRHSQ